VERPQRSSVPSRRFESVNPERNEDTLQGSQVSDDFRIAQAELRSTRFLTAITAVTAVVLAMTMVFGFQLMRQVMSPGPRPAAFECEEGEVDPCDEGAVCIAGRCRPAPRPARCQLGDACSSECAADPRLRCDDAKGVYVPVNAPTAAVCEEPRVSRFLQEIGHKCGSLSGCKAEDLKNWAIKEAEFFELMATFPGAVAVHFPKGKPPIAAAARAWPPPEVAEHYIESLRPLVPQLQSAAAVMIVGLASSGGAQAEAYSLERANTVVKKFISAVTEREGLSAAERDAIDSKFKLVILGDRKQLSPEVFGKELLARSIGWSRASEDRIRSFIEQGDAIASDDARALRQLINQAVLVVPIPCPLEAP
jgi:hypothetical protein